MNNSETTRRTSRREARERAVELAYEAQMRQIPVSDVLAGLQLPPDAFVRELLERIERLAGAVDEVLTATAKDWPLERMPALDLVIMRLATAELLEADTPTGVVLSEAVELATRYSTDKSANFVNGVLASVATKLRGD